jgi:hypothetical protein
MDESFDTEVATRLSAAVGRIARNCSTFAGFDALGGRPEYLRCDRIGKEQRKCVTWSHFQSCLQRGSWFNRWQPSRGADEVVEVGAAARAVLTASLKQTNRQTAKGAKELEVNVASVQEVDVAAAAILAHNGRMARR